MRRIGGPVSGYGFEAIGYFILVWIMALPITLTESHPKPIRILGLLMFVIWVLPVSFICLIPLVICTIGTLFEEI